MSRFLFDPLDAEQAIDTRTGRMAGQVYFVPSVANAEAPTVAELRDATFVGWITDLAGGLP